MREFIGPNDQPVGSLLNPEITAIAFDPSGKQLAYAEGSDVLLWDYAKKTTTTLISVSKHGTSSFAPTHRVHSLAFSKDGRLLAAGGILTSSDKGLLQSLPGMERTAQTGGEIRLIDIRGKQELISFKGHAGAVHWLAFAEDGRTLASAGTSEEFGGAIERREWDTGKVLDRLGAAKP